jgi:hypothetical protein
VALSVVMAGTMTTARSLERRDQQHRKRLITAAEAWLNLASQVRRLEVQLGSSDQ